MTKFYSLLSLLILLHAKSWGQWPQAEAYINRFSELAMQKMLEYRIPASITLAQGILESGSGTSVLAREANNHFGIKCQRGWEGKTFLAHDDEKNECFRAYNSPEESYHDHSLFLTTRPRYAALFELDIMDYKGWAYGLSKAGYATNPRYPELLIRIIERHQLYRFDSLVMRKMERIPPLLVHQDDHRFIRVNPSQFAVVGKSKLGRFVFENNRRQFVFARETDRLDKLADEFEIRSEKLRRYNELSANEEPAAGQMVYLQKKARRSFTHHEHLLREGESLHGVSQLYGIRLNSLLKMNRLHEGSKVKPGTVLKLR